VIGQTVKHDLEARSDESRRLCSERGGERLDQFLAKRFPDSSRSLLKRWVADGRVQGSRPLKPSTRLAAGEHVVVDVPAPPPPPPPLVAEDIPVPLLYQDTRILVIDKPPGLTVHPGAGQHSGTLVNALLGISTELSGVGGADRPGIVHRLDKDTSGVIIIARDDRAHRDLSAQFKARSTAKRYLAIVKGAPPERGTIDRPIGRNLRDRKKMAVREDQGRHAVTHFEVRERFADAAALIELRIETGRTHQIRVHMASLGYGILADASYGRRSPLDALIGRQALHARELSVTHPESGARCCFRAPIPSDIAATLEELRARFTETHGAKP
jgi:23S rRNA pseudouridine1911/1915/1917 synthase